MLKINFGIIITMILCIIVLISLGILIIYKYISFAGIIYLGAKGGE